MRVFGQTDRGMVRRSNQDSFACGIFDDGAAWAVVCDGMGGMNGGDIASKCAVEVIREMLLSEYKSNYNEKKLRNLFTKAAESANDEIIRKTEENSELAGMGTTMVIAVAKKRSVYIAHAGDSRAYIIGQEIKQATKDHSMVQALVDSGRLTPEEAHNHPRKNVITRALGADRSIEVDFLRTAIKKNNIILLCSDGLSNKLEPHVILEMSAMTELEKLPEEYIAKANAAGGEDNITAVVIENN